jgi:hypothetical protein
MRMLAVLALVVLAGCASLSREEAAESDCLCTCICTDGQECRADCGGDSKRGTEGTVNKKEKK